MNLALQITQLIYNISFIFTLILVIYTIKTYNNQKKQPYKLISRINYHFNTEKDGTNLVYLDIFNGGDYAAEMVEIQLIVNHNQPKCLDRINFIGPKENFEFYLGKRINKELILFNGEKYNLADPLDYDYFIQNTSENVVTLSIRVINN